MLPNEIYLCWWTLFVSYPVILLVAEVAIQNNAQLLGYDLFRSMPLPYIQERIALQIFYLNVNGEIHDARIYPY